MKLYKISQTAVHGWDTYSDAVVAAESEDEARTIHPGLLYEFETHEYSDKIRRIPYEDTSNDWTNDPLQVTVEYLGEAVVTINSPRVICSSYHAG